MKQLKAIPNHIEDDILGRITLSGKNIFSRSNEILVRQDISSTASGYLATITNSTSISGNEPSLTNTDISQFTEGDVVLLNKNGEVSFLYERNSHQNIIFTTALCNHHCIMCPQPPVLKDWDRTPFNLKLISLFNKDTKEVGISGGEPTMIGDNLFLLINQIKKQCPKASITILTNGVKFADKKYAMKLAMCHCHDLQIDIPLFSDISSTHNHIVGSKTFYKTVKGLYNLALFHQRIGIRIVIHKQTYKRLVQLADFIYHNFPFVSQIAFMEMETIGMAEKNIDELWIDPYDYNKELKEAVLLLNDRGMKTLIYNAQLCVLDKDIRAFAVQSISDWKDIYLKECDGCGLKGKCGGFFASNLQHHSKHIKPILDYQPMPEPCSNSISIFLKKFFKEKSGSGKIVYDIPCGYGRHSIWLSQRGYKVYGYDIDPNAIDRLHSVIEEKHLQNIIIHKERIENLAIVKQCDILINIHLYKKSYLQIFSRLIKDGGYLILETPENRFGNMEELPNENEIQNLLEKDFEFIIYKESKPKNGHVAVKLVAKKIQS